MAQLYDSEKVRQAAREVRELSTGLKDGTEGPGRRVAGGLEPLKGKAAEALDERVHQLNRKVNGVCGELEALSRALEEYAKALEAVDERLKTEMQRG